MADGYLSEGGPLTWKCRLFTKRHTLFRGRFYATGRNDPWAIRCAWCHGGLFWREGFCTKEKPACGCLDTDKGLGHLFGCIKDGGA